MRNVFLWDNRVMESAHQAGPKGATNEGLTDGNHQDETEHKEAPCGGEGHAPSEEDESKINVALEDLNGNQITDATPLAKQTAGLQKQEQQPPGPIVRWERFLPVRTLKVLLVENDDSTRQVVSALLRNCSYEVTAVANGLQAWKILEHLTNHVDLVLTEVVMPGLNGVGLLSKIMNHKTRKNVPVIMMSSSDSMGTVFKCLSKGAVDFLVKPIRKNELKNLWQHVWRRCHSSSGSGSGSGSESGIQTQKSVKSKSSDDTDNSSSSNDHDNESIDLNARDGSDHGSRTQSSWTKCAPETDSPQPMSPLDQLADPPDSTCAQVIRPTPETFSKDQMPTSAIRENHDDCMGKKMKIQECRKPEMQYESHSTEQDFIKLADKKMDKLPEKDSKNKGHLGTFRNDSFNDPNAQAANLIDAVGNSSDSRVVTRIAQAPSGFSKVVEEQDKINHTSIDLPSVELSLKRLRSIGESGTANQDDRNVLRRLELSAFSRYHTSATSNQAPTGCGGSCSPLDTSSEAIKTESMHNIVSSSDAGHPKQGSNGSNDNDMGSTTKNALTQQAAHKTKTAAFTSTVKCNQSTARHPVQYQASESQEPVQDNVETVTAASATNQPRKFQHQVLAQHHRGHHYHHHYHQVHNVQQHRQQPSPNHNDLSLKNKAGATHQCGSFNVFNGHVEGNAANYSINGSNSGSNYCSNRQDGSSNAIQTGGLNMERANGLTEQCGPGSGNGSGRGGACGVDQNRLAQREAALKKFRQKRKERNFRKKVRYQSRKKLADQRPRVRGQFVRQSVHEQNGRAADTEDPHDGHCLVA
ncbi:two-component response regulator-like PRR73 isoform X2 [Musa acuminata AAA Group]|uniref:two-component response regulator-like PRR73 isoform X2 n=1 Tax=Musa acuminata AAA Group TaxID=214697 RepID=UPI0031DC2E70